MSGQNQTDARTGGTQSDLNASLDWARSIASLIAAVFRLGAAEVSLAREDLGRLILVCVLIVPVFLLTWVALSVLVAWIVFELTASAIAGFAMFAAIQLFTSLILSRKFKTYQHSLTLPATRAQIMMVVDEIRNETSKQTSTDRNA